MKSIHKPKPPLWADILTLGLLTVLCLWLAHTITTWLANVYVVQPVLKQQVVINTEDLHKLAQQAMWERMQADNDKKTVRIRELESVLETFKRVESSLPEVKFRSHAR